MYAFAYCFLIVQQSKDLYLFRLVKLCSKEKQAFAQAKQRDAQGFILEAPTETKKRRVTRPSRAPVASRALVSRSRLTLQPGKWKFFGTKRASHASVSQRNFFGYPKSVARLSVTTKQSRVRWVFSSPTF